MSKRKEPVDFSAPSYFPKVVKMSAFSASSIPLSLPFGGRLAERVELRHDKREEDESGIFKPANTDSYDLPETA
ncbi:MAG: hypothetical protein D6719_09335 [Candidatus Dadabacteria bacterium]|nr:MAG: hypothetical protein D6719_09335 [Candidatus Dadabacteria bacterium]